MLDFGKDSDDDQEETPEISAEEVSNSGIYNNAKIELEHFLREFSDDIRLFLSFCKPADIKPLENHLNPNSVPTRAHQIKYNPG